jgi:hypothetical protein
MGIGVLLSRLSMITLLGDGAQCHTARAAPRPPRRGQANKYIADPGDTK